MLVGVIEGIGRTGRAFPRLKVWLFYRHIAAITVFVDRRQNNKLISKLRAGASYVLAKVIPCTDPEPFPLCCAGYSDRPAAAPSEAAPAVVDRPVAPVLSRRDGAATSYQACPTAPPTRCAGATTRPAQKDVA